MDGMFIDPRMYSGYHGGGGGGQTDILQVLGTIFGMVEDKKSKDFMKSQAGSKMIQDFISTGAMTPELSRMINSPRVKGAIDQGMAGNVSRAQVAESQARTAEMNQRMDDRDWNLAMWGMTPDEANTMIAQGDLDVRREGNKIRRAELAANKQVADMNLKQKQTEALMSVIGPALQNSLMMGGGGIGIGDILKAASGGGGLLDFFTNLSTAFGQSDAERKRILAGVGRGGKTGGPPPTPEILQQQPLMQPGLGEAVKSAGPRAEGYTSPLKEFFGKLFSPQYPSMEMRAGKQPGYMVQQKATDIEVNQPNIARIMGETSQRIARSWDTLQKAPTEAARNQANTALQQDAADFWKMYLYMENIGAITEQLKRTAELLRSLGLGGGN